MKHKILTALVMFALLAGLSACHEKWEPDGSASGDKGTLSTADLAVDLNNVDNIVSRASVELSDFIVTVLNADGAIVEKWKYAEMPGLPVFNVGNYTLRVESCTVQRAAFDAPYFVGEKQFTIVKDQITNAGTVVCTLQNLKVTVKFNDDLVAASAGDLECEIRVGLDGVLKFDPSEKRSGYFELLPGNITMVATFRGTVNGFTEEITRFYKDLNPGQHRIITFALKGADITPPAETGFLDPNGGINVDFSVEDEDLNINVDLGEDVIPGDRPGKEDWPKDPDDPDNPDNPDNPDTPTDKILFTSETLKLEEGETNGTDVTPAVVIIKAEEGMARLDVVISSTSDSFTAAIADLGIATFDLAHPGDLEAALSGLGLPTGDAVLNQTEVKFDITQFIPLLTGFPGTHTFSIKVTDNKGNVKAVNLVVVS